MPRQTSHWAGRDAPPHAPGAGLPGPKPARSGAGPGLRTDERPKGEFSTTEDRGRSPSPGLHRAATRTPRPLVCGSSSASRGGTPQDQGSAMLLSWVRAREHTHHKGFHKEEGPRWRQGTRAPPPGDPHCIGLPRLPSLPSLPSLWVSAATRTLPGGRARGVVQARPAQRRARGTERGPGILLPRPRARKMDPQGRLPAPQHGNKVPHGGTFRPTGATCATPPTRPGNPNPWHLLCLRTSARTHRPCGNPLSSFVLSLSLSPSRSHPLSPFPWRARAHRSFLSFAGPIRRTISHLPSQESVRASRLSRNPSTGALTLPCPDEG